jgi:hypothetical protein
MGDVLTFTPQPKPVAPEPPELLTGPALRASLEEAAQIALDAADRIIAVLDRLDGDPDLEDSGDGEPSLAAPENPEGSQIVYMRGNDQDREEEALEAALPDTEVEPSRWNGGGNVLAAAGLALISILERA